MMKKIVKEWAIPFFLLSTVFIVLEVSLKLMEENKDVLKQQLISIKENLAEASVRQEYLLRQINSQNDPAWIELVLKKELGLVPEGQQKIYFPSS